MVNEKKIIFYIPLRWSSKAITGQQYGYGHVQLIGGLSVLVKYIEISTCVQDSGNANCYRSSRMKRLQSIACFLCILIRLCSSQRVEYSSLKISRSEFGEISHIFLAMYYFITVYRISLNKRTRRGDKMNPYPCLILMKRGMDL